MTIDTWLRSANDSLSKSSVQTASLDALILLEYVISKDRAWILAHPEVTITAKQIHKLKNVLNKRSQHVPIAYILGKSEFYGRTFIINDSVLQPRPESEAFISLLEYAFNDHKYSSRLPSNPMIADVGTGSGAIGTTLALEYPNCRIELLEIDHGAAKVAKLNVDLFTLSIPVIMSDLLNNANHKIDIIVANLPYVPDTYHINTAAHHEPKIAIFGGIDGLDLYRRLFKQSSERPFKPLLLLIEALPTQHAELVKIAAKNSYGLIKTYDFVQLYAYNCTP